MGFRGIVALTLSLLLAIPMAVRAQEGSTSSDESSRSLFDTDLPPKPGSLLFPASTGHKYWLTGEFVFGWVSGPNLPPLVTTSIAGTDTSNAGILGDPRTSTLFSGRVTDNLRAGLRLGAGYLFDAEYGRGIEADFLFLGSQSSTFSATSGEFPILARPYIDANTEDPQAVLIAHPDQSTGSITIDAKSGSYYAVHLDTTERIWNRGATNVSCLFGYRYGHYDDALRFQQTIVPNALPGTEINSNDVFRARNDFNGLDLGLRAEHSWNNMTLNLLGRFSAGYLRREVNIQGRQTTTVGGVPTTAVGGVYALESNIGTHRDDDFVIWPELGGTLNWQVRPNVRVHLGYTAIMLNQIARASDQIDFTINPELFPPASPVADPLRPRFNRDLTDVWIHTVNLGVDFLF